ncbi:GFA family protein [Rhizobium sp. PL01]|uniref:GFA family protein n=1 Tax=Rhizobium sp. PL01 TaxID=3085631 RepID=UPI0029823EA0|nr:GFA family protein [Rhizobium sp. PL01]MDW5312623.1 GFA family protein [Rhizobium sp. PL01]
MAEWITGSCHCGAVQLSLAGPPSVVTECHCSICRRYAPLWAYYQTDYVFLTGPTDIYRWGRKQVDFHRCNTCGCVMAWLPRGDYPECGVNARMIDGFDLGAVTLIVEEDSSV